jgi:hypothetical protein
MIVTRYKRVPLVARAVIYLLGVILIGALTLWILPAVLTRHPSHGMTATQTLMAVNDVRTTLVAFIVAAGAAGTLWFTGNSYALNREGHVTDRYTKAVGQLGDDSSPVRVGGVYALERIGHDSAKDRTTIIYVLGAFIRERSRAPERKERPPEDLQAGIRVAGRLLQRSNVVLDLTEADLRNTDLSRLPKEQVTLERAKLEGAKLPASQAELHLYTGQRQKSPSLVSHLRASAPARRSVVHHVDLARLTRLPWHSGYCGRWLMARNEFYRLYRKDGALGIERIRGTYRVFFSLHYEADVSRVNRIKEMRIPKSDNRSWSSKYFQVAGFGFAEVRKTQSGRDGAEAWELQRWQVGRIDSAKRKLQAIDTGLVEASQWQSIVVNDDVTIERWIRKQMKRVSCVIVLIGSETAHRRWVCYEIEKAWADGKGAGAGRRRWERIRSMGSL